MKFNCLLLALVVILSACANLPAPSVPGEGRYLIMSTAGTPIAQIDARDEATCKNLGNSIVKRHANMSGHTRCETRNADAQLPYMAIARDSQLSIEITSRYRTEDLCKKAMTSITNAGNTVIRSCAKTS